MKTILNFLFLLGVMGTFSFCRKEAKIKLKAVNPQPVAYCYLSPQDTLIRLRLTRSQPLYAPQTTAIFEPVPGAVVNISGAQGSVTLNYNATTGYYEIKASQFPIRMGQTYGLRVVMPGGEVVTAETTVPAHQVVVKAVSTSTFQEQNVQGILQTLVFQDPAGVSNYYTVARKQAYYQPPQTDTLFSPYLSGNYYSDANFEGKEIELAVKFYGGINFSGSGTNAPGVIYEDVYLYNCNVDYYKFHTSLKNYSGEDPFAEPTLVYTNIKGGLGVFAAYTASYLRKWM